MAGAGSSAARLREQAIACGTELLGRRRRIAGGRVAHPRVQACDGAPPFGQRDGIAGRCHGASLAGPARAMARTPGQFSGPDSGNRKIPHLRPRLIGRIQHTYGIARDEAEKQVTLWEKDKKVF